MTLLALLGCEDALWKAFVADQQAVFDTTGKCPTELVGNPPLREAVEGRFLADGGEVEVVSDVAMVNASLGSYVDEGRVEQYVSVDFDVLVSLRHALPRSCFMLDLRLKEPERLDWTLSLWTQKLGLDPTGFFSPEPTFASEDLDLRGDDFYEDQGASYGFICLDDYAAPAAPARGYPYSDPVSAPWSGSWFAHFDAVEDPVGTVRPRNFFATFDEVECAEPHLDCCSPWDEDIDGQAGEDREHAYCVHHTSCE